MTFKSSANNNNITIYVGNDGYAKLFRDIQAFHCGEFRHDPIELTKAKEILKEMDNELQTLKTVIESLDLRFPHFQEMFKDQDNLEN